MSALEQLKRRRLFQWGIAYLAGAWVILQVLDVIGDKFGWPVAERVRRQVDGGRQ